MCKYVGKEEKNEQIFTFGKKKKMKIRKNTE